MLLSWTIYRQLWGSFGASPFAPHLTPWNLFSNTRDTDQVTTHSSHSGCQHGSRTSWPLDPPVHTGMQAQRHRPACPPASWILLQMLWSHSHWGELACLEPGVTCWAAGRVAALSCWAATCRLPEPCSNVSLVSSAGSSKVSGCTIKPSQGTPEGRGWVDRESSGSTPQSHSQNRGYWELAVHYQATNCTGSEIMCSQVLSQLPMERFPSWETHVPFTVTCLTTLELESGCSLSLLHTDLQNSLSPKATILGKKKAQLRNKWVPTRFTTITLSALSGHF